MTVFLIIFSACLAAAGTCAAFVSYKKGYMNGWCDSVKLNEKAAEKHSEKTDSEKELENSEKTIKEYFDYLDKFTGV